MVLKSNKNGLKFYLQFFESKASLPPQNSSEAYMRERMGRCFSHPLPHALGLTGTPAAAVWAAHTTGPPPALPARSTAWDFSQGPLGQPAGQQGVGTGEYLRDTLKQ